MEITLTTDMPILSPTGDLALRIRRDERLVIVHSLPLTMFVDAHERQCQRNHGQTLERIRERGGFGAIEALAVLSCTSYFDLGADRVSSEYAHRLLYQMAATHNRGMRVAEKAALQAA